MTIDANLLVGFKIGMGVGLVLGILIGAVMIWYGFVSDKDDSKETTS